MCARGSKLSTAAEWAYRLAQVGGSPKSPDFGGACGARPIANPRGCRVDGPPFRGYHGVFGIVSPIMGRPFTRITSGPVLRVARPINLRAAFPCDGELVRAARLEASIRPAPLSAICARVRSPPSPVGPNRRSSPCARQRFLRGYRGAVICAASEPSRGETPLHNGAGVRFSI